MSDENHRRVTELAHTIATAHSFVTAVALGGSHSVGMADEFADVDLVVLIEERPLLLTAREIKTTTDRILLDESTLVSGPTWKEGFGCRTCYIASNGAKFEVYVNCPITTPRVGRVLHWTPLVGSTNLESVQSEVRRDLEAAETVQQAVFAHTYRYMSLMRHASRGELAAVGYVAQNFVANTLALLLWCRGGEYDPFTSYKRITRDGWLYDSEVAAVLAAVRRPLDSLDAVMVLAQMIDDTVNSALRPLLKDEMQLRSWEIGAAARSACRNWAASSGVGADSTC
jgi:hypothetical protein